MCARGARVDGGASSQGDDEVRGRRASRLQSGGAGAHAKASRRVFEPRSAASVLLAGALVAGTGMPALAAADDDGADADGRQDGSSSHVDKATSQSSAEVSKTQVVYAKTDERGSLDGVYVVNSFEAQGSGTVIDEGDYDKAVGLTDSRAVGFSESAGLATFDVEEGDQFSYQGDLDAQTQMPWSVSVRYQLDGDDVEPDKLAGATGSLRMTLSIEPNEDCTGDWADNYLLQVTGAFSGDTTRSVSSEDATVAQSGDDTQLTYMVFPSSSVEYVVEAEVENFEFDGWQMVGVPLSMALDIDEGDFEGATDQLSELTDAIAQVDDGASELSDGTSSLASGAQSMAEGTRAVGEGIATLDDAGGSLAGGLSSVSVALESIVAGASGLTAGTDALVSGAEALAAGSSTYSDGLSAQASELRSQASSLGSAESVQAVLEQAIGVLATSDDPAEKAQAASQAQQAAQALAAVSSASGAATALDEAASGYAQIDAAIQGMVDAGSSSSVYALQQGAAALASGLVELDGGVGSLEEGTRAYVGSVGALASSFGEVESGADELASGAQSLDEGAGALADGTRELADETSDLDARMIDEIRDKVEEFLNPDFVMRDFVNGSEIERVQFVIKTAAIEAE